MIHSQRTLFCPLTLSNSIFPVLKRTHTDHYRYICFILIVHNLKKSLSNVSEKEFITRKIQNKASYH